ncbi:MAG: cytochrome c3 family protein [Bacillota bacterium]
MSVSAQAYENPHGPYGAFPAGCAACHVAHASPGAYLLQQPTITSLCLTCHDGTASSYDVVNAVYAGFSSTCGAVYYHPVIGVKDLLNNPAVGETIECTYCHNPHGDLTVGGQVYPRLLSSSDGTNRYNQGPEYCLACHGAVDHNFTGDTDTYWEDTLGDHRNPSAAHYLTAAPELLPASGTKVTCVMCHNKHAAPNSRLLAKVEENLCWSCHLKDESGSIHPVKAFSKTGSVHNVDGAGGSKLECSSCHGPHTLNYVTFGSDGVNCMQCHNVPSMSRIPYKLQGSYSVLSDPDNTKKGFSGAAGTGLGGTANTVGNLNDFCIKCHDGSPPTAVATVYEFVPYTVVFSETAITTNSGGWDKDGYKTTGHGTRTITCGDCHESHGSDYPALQRYGEDTADKDGECLRCHNSSYTGAADVKTDLTKRYSHPTLDFLRKHRNTENYQNMPIGDRHAECADCHDPHQCDNTTASAAPEIYGSLKGVSGVRINYGTSSWTNWPDGATFTSTLILPQESILYQYELCFKCHSYYSYGLNPPVSPSGGFDETDQAREFNPNNPGYHAVWGESRIDSPWGVFTGTDRFGNDWAYNSRMYCTDCHGSDSSTVPGPHGSTEVFLLKKEWNPDTNAADATGKTGTGDHLCFLCHEYDFYVTGEVTGTSKFSGSGHGSNLHVRGGMNGGHVAGCACCHGAIPHGYKRPGMLVVQGETPYDTGVKITGLSSYPGAGNWQKRDCSTTSDCHSNHSGMQSP